MDTNQLRIFHFIPRLRSLSVPGNHPDPGTASMLPKNAFGPCVLFFWRLNPLACIIEVLLMVVALVDSIRFATSQSLSTPSSKLLTFWKSLRVSVTATHLLRCPKNLQNNCNSASYAFDFPTQRLSQTSPLPSLLSGQHQQR